MTYNNLPKFKSHQTYTVDIGWDYLETWIKNQENVDLNPEFQRHLVWSDEKKIKYVEYILRGELVQEIFILIVLLGIPTSQHQLLSLMVNNA